MNLVVRSPLEQKPDYLVCTCACVMYSEIVDAIRGGAKDLKSLSDELLVGVGCSSCVAEVQQILQEELK